MAARSKPGCACGKTSPGTGGQLGLDELMIVNPGSFRTATYSLADDGNLYWIQGQGQDAARHGVGSYFLGDDGTLYQVQGIDADGTPELGDAAAGGARNGTGDPDARHFLGADGALYELIPSGGHNTS